MTFKWLTSLAKDTEKFKASVNEFETDISSWFKYAEDLTYDGSKMNTEDWYEYLEYDPYFQEEFNSIINDYNLPENDANFMPDVFDDKYLNMELGIPRYGDGPDFSKETKLLRDKDGLPIGRAQNNPILCIRMYEVE